MRGACLALVLGLIAATAGEALCEETKPTRRFGGCSANGSFCAGPSASASLAVVNLSKDGDSVTSGFIPGAGYGMTFMADRWYNVGLALHITVVTGGDAPAVISPVLMFSFAEYLRVGLGFEITDGTAMTSRNTDTLLLFGLGIDFGATPSSQGKGLVNALL